MSFPVLSLHGLYQLICTRVSLLAEEGDAAGLTLSYSSTRLQ